MPVSMVVGQYRRLSRDRVINVRLSSGDGDSWLGGLDGHRSDRRAAQSGDTSVVFTQIGSRSDGRPSSLLAVVTGETTIDTVRRCTAPGMNSGRSVGGSAEVTDAAVKTTSLFGRCTNVVARTRLSAATIHSTWRRWSSLSGVQLDDQSCTRPAAWTSYASYQLRHWNCTHIQCRTRIAIDKMHKCIAFSNLRIFLALYKNILQKLLYRLWQTGTWTFP